MPSPKPLFSEKLRRMALKRFERSARMQLPNAPRRVRELRVTQLYNAFVDEMKAKPDELTKIEYELRGLAVPGPMIQSLKERGREQIQQRVQDEARRIQIASR